MRILVVTNRNIENRNSRDATLFGEGVNSKGSAEIRLAWAEKIGGNWKVDLFGEPRAFRTSPVSNLPSSRAFTEFRTQLDTSNKDCVFFINGYNLTFIETLEQADDIQSRYDVEMVLFSWPANPGGFIGLDYPRSQAIASNSVIALDRTFDRLGRLVREHIHYRCNCSFNLLIHSLGNYLFKHFVRSPVFSGETRFFDNIVLNAPDVDSSSHAEWVNKLRYSRRIYVTINERDQILDASDIINQDRLGNTARNLNADRTVYVDFTDGDRVGKNHAHFTDSAKDNATVHSFFDLALHGSLATSVDGLKFNEAANSYELE